MEWGWDIPARRRDFEVSSNLLLPSRVFYFHFSFFNFQPGLHFPFILDLRFQIFEIAPSSPSSIGAKLLQCLNSYVRTLPSYVNLRLFPPFVHPYHRQAACQIVSSHLAGVPYQVLHNVFYNITPFLYSARSLGFRFR